MSLSTTSKQFLNTSRDGNSTTSLGTLFQCLTTLSVKTFFLISNLNLPWFNLRPFPLILSPVTSEKRPTSILLHSCLLVILTDKDLLLCLYHRFISEPSVHLTHKKSSLHSLLMSRIHSIFLSQAYSIKNK